MHVELTTINNRPCLFSRYESLDEVQSAVRERVEGHERNYHMSFAGRRWVTGSDLKPFTGWDGKGGLTTQINSAWPKGMAKVESMLKELRGAVTQKPRSRRRRRSWSADTGDDICLERLRAGREEFWRHTERKNTDAPTTVTVIVNVAANSDKESTEILWRGAAAICLTELLQEAGYNVELWVAYKAGNVFTNGTDSLVGIRAKEASHPANRSALVNAVSGWFFRTIGFGSEQLADKKLKLTARSSLGHASTVRDEDRERITPDTAAVVVDGAWSLERAIDTVREKLTEMGVM